MISVVFPYENKSFPSLENIFLLMEIVPEIGLLIYFK